MAVKFGKQFLEEDGSGAPDRDKVLDAFKGRWDISPEDYKRRVDEQLEREKHVPKVGDEAPDFELETLSPNGERTGATFKLSEMRGAPLAIAFGSYT